MAWAWITSPHADGWSETEVQFRSSVCTPPGGRSGCSHPEGGEEHTQWIGAFYLEVVTFQPQDTELSVQRRKKVLLPFAIWISVLEAVTTVI